MIVGRRPDLVVALFDAEAVGHRIVISGDLDTDSIRDIRPQLLAVADRGDGDAHLDLGDVGFADSSALAMLAAMERSLRHSGRRLVIERSSQAVSRVLELAGLADSTDRPADPSAVQVPIVTRTPGPFAHELIFEGDSAAPSVARAAATRWLGAESPLLDDVLIVISELVTNVVLHTSDGGALLLDVGPPVSLEVHDTSSALPVRPPSSGSHGGFGLRLVERIAERWSAEPTTSGKVVRVQLPSPATT